MPRILFFPYFGPNRRSDRRVVEIMLDFSTDGATEFPQHPADIEQLLLDAGIPGVEDIYRNAALPNGRMAWYATLLAHTALLFQRNCRHQVEYTSVSCDAGKKRCIALVEHEHSEVGMAAVKLACEIFSNRMSALTEVYRQFSEFALERVLPLETEVIIQCARQRKVPVFQLEREPLTGKFDTGFRVRTNGLLMLGHGATTHVVDGTFCVSLAGDYLRAMLRNPGQRLALLKSLAIPTGQRERDGSTHLRQFSLLIINQLVTAVEHIAGRTTRPVNEVHKSLVAMCLAISEKVNCSPAVVNIRTADLTRPLVETGGWVEGFELAPDLGQLLGRCDDGRQLLETAANNLLEWLFPGHASGRIPVIAVTGTNGKTTTSRMLNHIMHKSGRKPGLVCTDGIFLNGKQLTQSDASSFIGHARVLTSGLVDIAVLETHHRGIAVRGFAFQKCDVAICLNVTEEHLQEGEIESVEEMTVIKRALLEHASDTAVLFADDENCMTMLEHLDADRICLVSLQSDVAQLREAGRQRGACFCVLESVGDEEWIVLYNQQQCLPVMPVTDIPATFDGTARFNVSNAMHAIAASYFAGTDIALVRSALSSFSAGPALTPGRMNVFDDLPFRVIIDFAHNPDGMKQIVDFVKRQTVPGRKLIAFAGAGNRTEGANAKLAKALAGHFDFYFCKDYAPRDEAGRIFRIAPQMQQVLIDNGVPAEQTAVVTFGQEAIFSILDACKPGDLLILLLGFVEKRTAPGYISDYARMGSGRNTQH